MSAAEFDTQGITLMGGIAWGKSYTRGITPIGGIAGAKSYTRGITPIGGIAGAKSYTRGITPMSESAGAKSYASGVTLVSESAGGESYTRGITLPLSQLIPLVSPQSTPFFFSGRTPSGLNSHCGVRSAFSFPRTRFLFPCGGVV